MEARLYKPIKGNKVSWNLCMHKCIIKDGNREICNVRKNNGGVLETFVYGRLVAEHIDPIEKKPLFLAESIGSETPWHISRFHPTYKLFNSSLTPAKIINAARATGIRAGLKYLYTGNVHGDGGKNTYCSNCGKILIERLDFYVTHNIIVNRTCLDCGAEIDVIL